MKTNIKQALIIEIISGLFCILFLYAAAMKLLDYEKFKEQLSQSPMLTAFADYIVWFIPTVEISIAGLLMFDTTRLLGLYASFSLMVMFTAYIVAILGFSDYVPCACGGILEKMSWKQHLIFNGFDVLIAAVGVVLQFKIKQRDAAAV